MDSTYVPAHWTYLRLAIEQGRRPEVLREYERLARAGDPAMSCYAAAAARPGSGGASEAPRVYAMARRHGIPLSPCLTLLLAELVPFAHDVPGLPPSLALRRQAVAIAGELSSPWLGLFTDLLIRGDTSGAESVLEAGLLRVRHPLQRLGLLSQRAASARSRGLHAIADARWAAIAAAAERDGRPAVLFAYRSYRAQLSAEPLNERELEERATLLARAPGGVRAGHFFTLASFHTARGDFARAIPFYDRALAIADSLPDRGIGVDYRLNKGRALSRMGLMADAERILREGLRLSAGTNLTYTRAELWHNLSHTHEGTSAMALAVSASDSFVALASQLDREPIRIISRRDAGLLRLNLGWHAAAHAQFDSMVRLIDAERQNHHWAGEYYERVGNTRAALTFYQRGVALDAGERSLNLSGLARMHEALGFPDSAAAAARDHDAFIRSATEVPLTPDVLSRAGRHADAIRIAQRWARQREAGENVHGAALARLQTARILLAANRPIPARSEARRAERHAAALNLTAERVEALRLIGVAAGRAGRHADAVAPLEEAARIARVQGDVRLVRETHLALGDARARLQETDAALAAYDRAARAVEDATARMTDDVDRARYRAVHLAPFDAAVRALLRAQPARHDELARWSARRKAATLAFALRGGSAGTEGKAPRLSLASLRQALAPDEAIVDYLVLPEAVAALVVRRDTLMLATLGVQGDSLAMLARRMTAGFSRRGARVDLARLAFDSAAASRLHASLIAPLAAALRGASRVTVVPDGVIHHVPFALLSTGDRYLLDDMEVRYALSLSFAYAPSPAPVRGAPLLLVRTDVPGAEREGAAIQGAWNGVRGGRVTQLANGAATEQALRHALSGARIVHFATHAEASDRNPLATHLRLAPAPGADGLLHVAEVAAGNYAGTLVVLAACESVAGELLTGEGFMGLSRAFLAAGAAGVIATRWPVDATAADFSAAFYASLARGSTVAASTRAAQLALRNRPETSHPFYWAGYVAVQGSSTPTTPLLGTNH